MKIKINFVRIIFVLIFIILGAIKLIEINKRLIKETYIPSYNQTSFNKVVEFLNADTELNYYFTPKINSKKTNLIFLKIGTYQNKKINCRVKINVYEEKKPNNLKWLTSSSLNCQKIKDNNFNKFVLDSEIDLLKNKKYLLRINIEGDKKNYLAFYYLSKNPSPRNLFILNKSNLEKNVIDGELSIFIGKIILDNKSFIYSIISFFLYILLILIYLYLIKFSNKKVYFNFIFLFTIGLFWLIIVPPFHGADEHEHFARIAEISSFHISSARYNARFSNYSEGYKNLIDNTLWKEDFLSKNIFFETINSININLGRKNQAGFTLAGSYNPFSHLHLAFVMKILEIFNMKPIIIFYLLRLTNLLLFVFLISLTININAKLKEFILLLGSFPGIASQAAVISTDSIITASIIYSFFYTLNKEKKHSLLEKLSLIFSILYISFTKYVYVFIAITTIFILIFRLNQKLIVKAGIFLTFVLIIFSINILWLKYINFNPENKDIRFENTNPQKQLLDIKKNLLHYTSLYNNLSINNFITRLEIASFRISNNYKKIIDDNYLSGIGIFIFFLISLKYSQLIENKKLNFLYVILFLFSSYLTSIILILIFNISYQTLSVPNRYFGFYCLIPISLGFLFKRFYKFNFNLDLFSVLIFINILNLISSLNLFLPLWFN